LVSVDQFFKDPVLRHLLRDGVQNTFGVRTAHPETAHNKTYYNRAKLAYLPSLNLNLLSIEKQRHSHNSSPSAEDDWYDHKGKQPPKDGYISSSKFSNSAALDWELDIWGKMRKKQREARALYRQSHVARRSIQTELVATIAEDYYSLLMLDEQLDVAQKNMQFRDSTLQMVKLLYNSGEVSALAVQQSRTQVLEAASLISELKEKRETQENNLRLLTGKLPGEINRETKLSAQDSVYEEVRELPLYLVQNRPDVLMARYDLTAANANVGVKQVQRYPSLTISVEGGMESVLPENWFNIPGSLLGNFIGGFTAPIFNGGELRAEYEVAKLERDEAEIDFQRTVYSAVVDIKNTLLSLKRLE